jgi:tryptophanyl-tRNA synthetase
VVSKIRSAKTDVSRISIKEKGNPDICTVFQYHAAFNSSECENIREMCRNAGIGCAACKKSLSNVMNTMLSPVREKRREYEENMELVKEILLTGTEEIRRIAEETMKEIREAMSIGYFE